MGTLVLLRHGESEWNAADRFAGWVDVALTETGRQEARRAGALLAAAGLLPDEVHTSVLTRAITTAHLTLEACDRLWIPTRRSWRLNERHYGALQGRRRADVIAEYGEARVRSWRRSYSAVIPPMDASQAARQAQDPRYAGVAAVPAAESLAEVSARIRPYFQTALAPALCAGRVVCVVAHGNSIRVLMKDLDRLSSAALGSVDVPTGIPIVYHLDCESARAEPARYLR